MESLKIEILSPKALQLIKQLEELNLINISEEPATKLQAYLKKMRKKEKDVPSLDEISKIVDEVRTERYGNN